MRRSVDAGHSPPKGLLEVRDLSVEFATSGPPLRVVDHVSLRVERGEIVGLVGESGCGKSTLGMSLLGLVPQPGSVVGGQIIFEGRNLLDLCEADMRELRGAAISFVAQDALAVLNPVTTVGEQIGEVIRDHRGLRRKEIYPEVLTMLRQLRLPNPALNARQYPHQLSGGMQQRVVIAESLVLGPRLIVADEPTTALDVTVQAQILSLLRSIRDATETSVLFITHDLAIVAELCDRVLVMYAGRIIEAGSVREIFGDAAHPYTQALLAGLLPLGGEPPEKLDALQGQPPRADDWPTGCRFHPRCPLRAAVGDPVVCVEEEPKGDYDAPHWTACHLSQPERADRVGPDPGGVEANG